MEIKKLYEKYKDVIPYLFFGICTTVVNVAVFWIIAHVVNLGTIPSTIIAWIVAVLFAYLTNREWVFHNEAKDGKVVVKEVALFFLCRLATGIVDWTCMWVFIDLAGWNDVVIKFLANGVVISLNYVASKLVIFKKEKEE